MTSTQFYRAYVWAPLVCSGVVTIAILLGWNPAHQIIGDVAGIVLISGIYGGIPYAALAIWTTRWLRDKSPARIRWLAVRMPLLFAAIYTPCAVVVAAIVGGGWLGVVSLAGGGIYYIVLLGYAYVGLGLLLERLLRANKWLADPPTTQAPP